MLLKHIIEGYSLIMPAGLDTAFNVDKIENDSRNADQQTLFIAASGYVDDAHPYIESAYKNGCRYFVISAERLKEFRSAYPDAYFIGAENIFEALAYLARNFYENPSGKLCLVGITGTSGKTTTAFAAYSLFQSLGFKGGLIGTIEYRIGSQIFPASNTTPDILYLNRLFAQMASDGVKYCVMEVSSHALSLGRVAGLHFDIAAFTNFSQDHLDFHKTMENYFEAKLKIFDLLSSSQKKKRTALINMDIPLYDKMVKYLEKFKNIILKTYSVSKKGSDYPILVKQLTPDNTEFEINTLPIRISMMGITNVYNFSVASIILMELSFSLEIFKDFLYNIKVAGRMENVPNKRGFSVIIDYAHKPDALEKLLQTVRNILRKNGRVITVFGAGGDRDRSKRPLMGRIAGKLSDFILITSDNPRTEDPLAIIQEIEEGVKETGGAPYEIEAERSEAIKIALKKAVKDDIVVIAGKGHEDYQIIGKTKRHFSDREEVEKYFLKEGYEK